jgi:hypothetical protein
LVFVDFNYPFYDLPNGSRPHGQLFGLCLLQLLQYFFELSLFSGEVVNMPDHVFLLGQLNSVLIENAFFVSIFFVNLLPQNLFLDNLFPSSFDDFSVDGHQVAELLLLEFKHVFIVDDIICVLLPYLLAFLHHQQL